ncbi:MAG: reverse transcriptase family protein [Candidatus Thiodiazotropha sp.]
MTKYVVQRIKDKATNNEGNRLLETCKSNNLFILNGRCGKDKGIGEYTFKSISVIDYSISTAEALKFIHDFEVTELDSLYTDGHAVLTTTLKFDSLAKDIIHTYNIHKTNQRPKWQESKSSDFVKNLDSSFINEIICDIQQARHNLATVNTEIINMICNKIQDSFTTAADKSFDAYKNTRTNNISDAKSKRWFGYKCQSARRKYNIARKINRQNPSKTNKINLKQASKIYKCTMNIYINKFDRETQDKLRNLKSKSPKDFWKIINSVDRNNDNPDINIETLFDFFKTLNENKDNDNDFMDSLNIDVTDDDEILNSFITEAEILKCIKLLKNNKCSANDKIINEYIKYSSDIMIPIYIALFNLVLDTGLIPDSWLEGIIRPIYKRSGSPDEPENYRPITILSCFGKLFTSVLNQRLNEFLTHYNILEENQAGFRSGYSTTDHIFNLHALTEILKSKNKRLFCSFIDFSKAFDSVWRIGLWMKLLSNNINGKIFRVIFNLYQNIKSCIIYSGKQSGFFQSYCGVRQGENLSPILFSLFLNDLEDYLTARRCLGINLTLPEDDVETFLKILVLLYADDTVIFGTDEKAFQENLDAFFDYSQLWKLNINYSKTKIMIFGARNIDNFQFKLGETNISICEEFKYLGVVFSKTRTFYKAIKHNVEQAKKALHLLYKRINNLHIPIDLQIQLFDQIILPILLYGCEIWGFQNTNMIEIVHNQFLRNITKLRKSTPIYMIYAELGRMPIDIIIKSRMIGFWISLVNGNGSKYAKKLYNIMYNDYLNNGTNYKWIAYIKQILISVGKPDLFNQSLISYPKATKSKIVTTLKDLFVQDWNSKMNTSSKSRNYNIFKHDQIFESYLITLPRYFYLPMIKFRTANHKLPIETGRWENISLQERKCVLCDKNDIGDELHYLLICPFFANERKELLKKYYYTRPNILKYKDLLTSKNKSELVNLSKFMKLIMNKFS